MRGESVRVCFVGIFFFTLGFILAHSSISFGRLGDSTALLLVVVILGAQIGRLGEDGT